jgi:hypothetical protein
MFERLSVMSSRLTISWPDGRTQEITMWPNNEHITCIQPSWYLAGVLQHGMQKAIDPGITVRPSESCPKYLREREWAEAERAERETRSAARQRRHAKYGRFTPLVDFLESLKYW